MKARFELILTGVVVLLVLAFACFSCASAPPAELPRLNASVEQDVRAIFPRERISKVQQRDGSFALFVYLKPRPAAPNGGLVIYQFDSAGILRSMGPIVK